MPPNRNGVEMEERVRAVIEWAEREERECYEAGRTAPPGSKGIYYARANIAAQAAKQLREALAPKDSSHAT